MTIPELFGSVIGSSVVTMTIGKFLNRKRENVEVDNLYRQGMNMDMSLSKFVRDAVDKETQKLRDIIIEQAMEHNAQVTLYLKKIGLLEDQILELNKRLDLQSKDRNDCWDKVAALSKEMHSK